MEREVLGTAPDGGAVEQVRISGGGLTAWIMNWGACLRDLRLEGHPHPLVLGFDRFEPYPLHSRNFGAVVGRCANRIRDGRFALDGTVHQLDRNAGVHHLHGGTLGISKRTWRIEGHTDERVRLTLSEPDGWMGYPGACRFTVTYSMAGAATLHLRIEAEADRPTLVNLAPHGYFNLDGSETIGAHELRIDAAAYLPTDGDGIPTGEVRAVAGTAFDFRVSRSVDRGTREDASPFDHNYCLSAARVLIREVAYLRSPLSGVAMTMATTEPGLQFYDGSKLDVPVAGLEGRRYGRRAGLCLEPQIWPDAINHPDFPSPVVRPGERYLHETSYRFALAA
jgi:aldose 1-epimerase